MNDDKTKTLKTMKEVRIISDPYRREIMAHMSLYGKPVTAMEIATMMDEAPSKVNYHMKVLAKYGFIDLHHTKNINGIIANYYTRNATTFSIDIDGRGSLSNKVTVYTDIISSTFDDMKDKYIEGMANLIKNYKDDDKNIYDYLGSTKAYLSQEELKQLTDLIDSFNKGDKEGKELFTVFTAIIKE